MSSSIPLSHEKLTNQLNTFNLLQSIYCMEGEFKLDDDDTTADLLQNILSDSSISLSLVSSLPSHLRFTLCITHSNLSLDLRVSLPLRKKEEEKEEKDLPHIHLSCPSWMNRKTYTELATKMKETERKEREERGEEEDGTVIMAVVDFLREYLPTCEKQIEGEKDEKTKEEDSKIVRVWYYLPSLSTKEKREDMVEYGKSYNLTGVVVAGKPGVVCVEGVSSSISSYLTFIKNVSWADIPPAHKKITERLREEEDKGKKIERAFETMKEVTEEVYQAGMRGTRGNRGDMKELKSFLDKYGLGDRLEKVLEI